MRHGNHNRKFGRESGQRAALLNSLAENLLKHGRIETSEAKAKELRPFVEKLITRARVNTLANRRLLISRLGTEARVKKLMTVAPKYVDRKGGYTRIVKLPRRLSDGSPQAIIELI
jgi:large subunit ribosomal protein L17